MRRVAIRAFGLLCLVLAFQSYAASGQSYGLGDQILTIGPEQFRPNGSGATYALSPSDGYLYGYGFDYVAPLRLPDGAEITMMCFYFYDPGANGMQALIQAVKLPAAGQPAGVIVVPNSVVTETLNIGYASVCTSSLSYTFHDDADLDGLGIAHLANEVFATTIPGTAIGGVRITWHRQVSPAPGTATFNDVPTTHPFFQYIEALSASGVTGGCQASPPLYCPDNPITRGQMAVFISKALGLHWPN